MKTKEEVVRFTACKHLDFADEYTAKKQVLHNGKVFWLRDVAYNPLLPAEVQFCTKRGRLNNPEACLTYLSRHCDDYAEGEHVINVSKN